MPEKDYPGNDFENRMCLQSLVDNDSHSADVRCVSDARRREKFVRELKSIRRLPNAEK